MTALVVVFVIMGMIGGYRSHQDVQSIRGLNGNVLRC